MVARVNNLRPAPACLPACLPSAGPLGVVCLAARPIIDRNATPLAAYAVMLPGPFRSNGDEERVFFFFFLVACMHDLAASALPSRIEDDDDGEQKWFRYKERAGKEGRKGARWPGRWHALLTLAMMMATRRAHACRGVFGSVLRSSEEPRAAARMTYLSSFSGGCTCS